MIKQNITGEISGDDIMKIITEDNLNFIVVR